LRGEDEVALRPQTTEPAVTTAMAATTAKQARTLLSAPVTLEHRGRTLGQLTPAELAPLLTVRRTRTGHRVAIDPAGLRRTVRRDVARVGRPAEDARWSTDGRRATVGASRPGLGLDARRTALAVVEAGLTAERRARVRLAPTTPGLTTAEAHRLGVREKVASATTDMGASSPNRVHNVHLMADMLDGHVIAPGATFSFNAAVGERTVERGFREGQAIADGLLIPSIGGGVCQVATTVFGGAFHGGYPVSQRVNHSFHIAHYGVGMDAAVAWGGPDLVFTNDSAHAVLIRMSYTDSTLTTGFYSTPRGLTVESSTSEPTAVRQPRTRYLLDPDLAGTAAERRTRGEQGFDVTVERVVRRDGEVVRRDTFRSSYDPEDVVVHVGPEFAPPHGARVERPPAVLT
jgi:vancomycin resistance protein YoaR